MKFFNESKVKIPNHEYYSLNKCTIFVEKWKIFFEKKKVSKMWEAYFFTLENMNVTEQYESLSKNEQFFISSWKRMIDINRYYNFVIFLKITLEYSTKEIKETIFIFTS